MQRIHFHPSIRAAYKHSVTTDAVGRSGIIRPQAIRNYNSPGANGTSRGQNGTQAPSGTSTFHGNSNQEMVLARSVTRRCDAESGKPGQISHSKNSIGIRHSTLHVLVGCLCCNDHNLQASLPVHILLKHID